MDKKVKSSTRICWHCYTQVNRAEKICPVCGRLLFRNYEAIGWEDLQETPEEVPGGDCGNVNCMQAIFEAAAEETEDDLSGNSVFV